MKLKEIIIKYNWNDILPNLLKLYPDSENSIDGYKEFFERLKKITPAKSNMTIVLEERIDEYSKEHYVDVSGKQPPDAPYAEYALDFMDWSEFLGMEIDNKTLTEYDELEIIVHCMYEMTFYGNNREEIRNKGNDLSQRVSNADINNAILYDDYLEELAKQEKYLSLNEKTIFISYSWKDKHLVDKIDNDFRKIGIKLTRDIRDVNYTQSIKEFMKKIRQTDYVLMIISKSYLQSINCMFEVLEFIKDENYKNRILPIILEDAKIYDTLEVSSFISYWKKKYDKLDNEIEVLDREEIGFASDALRVIRGIRSSMGEFLTKIVEMKFINGNVLEKCDYEEILKVIGVKDPNLYKKTIDVMAIKNIEDKEFELDQLLISHPDNPHIVYAKAYLEESKKNYKNAKKYYEKIVNDLPMARKKMAYLYEKHFKEYKKAIACIEDYIKTDPTDSSSYHWLARIFMERYDESKKAKEYLDKAIEINPYNYLAYQTLSVLLCVDYKDFKKARECLDKAIEINPYNINLHKSMVFLLKKYFNDETKINEHLKKIDELKE